MSDKLTWRQAAEATKELLNSMTRERDELRKAAEYWHDFADRANATADKFGIDIRNLERERDELRAEVERLQVDVRELNGMVAMLNEQLIEWKRRAEIAEARLARLKE